jgi:hypothetical protein
MEKNGPKRKVGGIGRSCATKSSQRGKVVVSATRMTNKKSNHLSKLLNAMALVHLAQVLEVPKAGYFASAPGLKGGPA